MLFSILLIFFIILTALTIYATPGNVGVSYISNTTKSATNGTLVNYTGNGNQAGGYIFTITVNGTAQNSKWKAFVGNVSGSLTLDDASGATIYDWQLTTISGEIYATRTAGTVTWTNINCSYTNTTEQENWIMNQTSGSDNITKTFDGADNKAFSVGTVQIYASTCPTTNLYINDTKDATDQFEEVVLYDGGPNWFYNRSAAGYNGTFGTFGNIVYAEVLEQDVGGFRTGYTYDFQMIVPERGFDGWTSSTAYYFYVELT